MLLRGARRLVGIEPRDPVRVAVGEQDHDLALRVAAAQLREREREAVADRGAELGHVADHEVADDLLEQLGVLRQRALQHRLLAEDHEADAVVLVAAQEPADHALRGIDAVARHVGLLHRLRHVDDDHDVDRVDLVLDRAIRLGPRERRPRAPRSRARAARAGRSDEPRARAARADEPDLREPDRRGAPALQMERDRARRAPRRRRARARAGSSRRSCSPRRARALQVVATSPSSSPIAAPAPGTATRRAAHGPSQQRRGTARAAGDAHVAAPRLCRQLGHAASLRAASQRLRLVAITTRARAVEHAVRVALGRAQAAVLDDVAALEPASRRARARRRARACASAAQQLARRQLERRDPIARAEVVADHVDHLGVAGLALVVAVEHARLLDREQPLERALARHVDPARRRATARACRSACARGARRRREHHERRRPRRPSARRRRRRPTPRTSRALISVTGGASPRISFGSSTTRRARR